MPCRLRQSFSWRYKELARFRCSNPRACSCSSDRGCLEPVLWWSCGDDEEYELGQPWVECGALSVPNAPSGGPLAEALANLVPRHCRRNESQARSGQLQPLQLAFDIGGTVSFIGRNGAVGAWEGWVAVGRTSGYFACTLSSRTILLPDDSLYIVECPLHFNSNLALV